MGRVRDVQLIPSGEVAAMVLLCAIATKVPFPYVTDFQAEELGIVLDVHVIPSGELAAVALNHATATKTPLPYATEYHCCERGRVLAVHAEPSEVTDMLIVADALPEELVAVIV